MTIGLASFQLGLMAILFIVLQWSSMSATVNAYKTYRLVEYCRRFDRNDIEFSSQKEKAYKMGLVIPDKYAHQSQYGGDGEFPDEFDDDDDDDNKMDSKKFIGPDFAGKTVTVDTGYDNSAIRLIVEREDVVRAQFSCSILVMPKKPNGLIVTLRKLHVRPGTDWLRISINNSSFTRTFSHIRINGERDSVAYVAHHGVLIEFGTKNYLPKSEDVEMEIILTSFREADLCNIDREFDCGSFRCISGNYVCDGYNNCGDGRDEAGCPMDNLANYLIISTTLLLTAFLIFLCLCYRCCFQRRNNRNPYRKQYQYLKIRTSSVPVPYRPRDRRRTQSIQSEADLPPHDNNVNNQRDPNLKRVKFAHVGDSLPVLVPTAPPPHDYGSTRDTYYLPYPHYTIQLGATGRNGRPGIGLVPIASTSATIPEHHTFPLQQPTYPMLHPQLFTPPAHTPPPPPYTPRAEPPPPPLTAETAAPPASTSGSSVPGQNNDSAQTIN